MTKPRTLQKPLRPGHSHASMAASPQRTQAVRFHQEINDVHG